MTTYLFDHHCVSVIHLIQPSDHASCVCVCVPLALSTHKYLLNFKKFSKMATAVATRGAAKEQQDLNLRGSRWLVVLPAYPSSISIASLRFAGFLAFHSSPRWLPGFPPRFSFSPGKPMNPPPLLFRSWPQVRWPHPFAFSYLDYNFFHFTCECIPPWWSSHPRQWILGHLSISIFISSLVVAEMVLESRNLSAEWTS